MQALSHFLKRSSKDQPSHPLELLTASPSKQNSIVIRVLLGGKTTSPLVKDLELTFNLNIFHKKIEPLIDLLKECIRSRSRLNCFSYSCFAAGEKKYRPWINEEMEQLSILLFEKSGDAQLKTINYGYFPSHNVISKPSWRDLFVDIEWNEKGVRLKIAKEYRETIPWQDLEEAPLIAIWRSRDHINRLAKGYNFQTKWLLFEFSNVCTNVKLKLMPNNNSLPFKEEIYFQRPPSLFYPETLLSINYPKVGSQKSYHFYFHLCPSFSLNIDPDQAKVLTRCEIRWLDLGLKKAQIYARDVVWEKSRIYNGFSTVWGYSASIDIKPLYRKIKTATDLHISIPLEKLSDLCYIRGSFSKKIDSHSKKIASLAAPIFEGDDTFLSARSQNYHPKNYNSYAVWKCIFEPN